MASQQFALISARVLTLVAVLLVAHPASADIFVIGNEAGPVRELTLEQLTAIALGRNVALPGRVRLQFVEQSSSRFVFHDFHHRVTGLSRLRLDAYWARKVFTGPGRAPRRVADDAAVTAAVSADPMLVGYLEERPAAGQGVRVLLVLEGELTRKR